MEMSIRFPNLGVNLGNVGKSVQLSGFELTYYGILICIGMLIGIWFVILEAKRSNQDQDLYLKVVICSLLGGIIGARLYYVEFSLELYSENWVEMLNPRTGGFAIYGGILGGALVSWLYCRIKKLNFIQLADTVCMGLLIGQIIGRWGDFFNRESFGGYTDGLLAMALPLSAVNSSQVTEEMMDHIQTFGGVSYVQVHPAFLYEILWNLILLIVILGIRRRKKFQGEIFLIYLTGYGMGRFWIEGIRTDQLLISGTNLGVSCILSVILTIFCGITIVAKEITVLKRAKVQRRRREVENAEFTEETDGSTEIENRDVERTVGQPTDESRGHSSESETE